MSETSVYPDRLFEVSALRRSGHHAFIQYLAGCLEASGLTWGFANDVDNNLPINHPDRKQWSIRSVLAKGLGRNALIANYEDLTYRQLATSPMHRGLHDSGISEVVNLILVRDYYNLAATRIIRLSEAERNGQYYKLDLFSLIHARDIWIEQAKMALQQSPGMPVIVLYNRLVERRDSLYRQSLVSNFGLIDSPGSLDKVPGYGGGSSVDGQQFDGRAAEMNVLKRWNDLTANERAWFLDAVNDPEIDELNYLLFGFGFAEVKEDLGAKFNS